MRVDMLREKSVKLIGERERRNCANCVIDTGKLTVPTIALCQARVERIASMPHTF